MKVVVVVGQVWLFLRVLFQPSNTTTYTSRKMEDSVSDALLHLIIGHMSASETLSLPFHVASRTSKVPCLGPEAMQDAQHGTRKRLEEQNEDCKKQTRTRPVSGSTVMCVAIDWNGVRTDFFFTSWQPGTCTKGGRV